MGKDRYLSWVKEWFPKLGREMRLSKLRGDEQDKIQRLGDRGREMERERKRERGREREKQGECEMERERKRERWRD